VRLFNPFNSRNPGTLSKAAQMLVEFRRPEPAHAQQELHRRQPHRHRRRPQHRRRLLRRQRQQQLPRPRPAGGGAGGAGGLAGLRQLLEQRGDAAGLGLEGSEGLAGRPGQGARRHRQEVRKFADSDYAKAGAGGNAGRPRRPTARATGSGARR
jgi:hypothetical protein